MAPHGSALRVVHIHHGNSPGWGGGVVAMLRLHERLRAAGVQSTLLCGVATGSGALQIPRRRWLEEPLRVALRPLGLNDLHAVRAFALPRHPAVQGADVVHVHGLHGGFFSYLALPALTRNRPVVYTLHDMWSFTGHCAASYGCERWRSGCGRCPNLSSPPAVRRDATGLEWRLKRWAYRRSGLTVVAVSRWLAGLARESILGHFPVHHIPNAVDTAVYRPLDRATCRALLRIPAGRKVIAWVSGTMDPAHPEGFRKGADLFVATVRALPDRLRRRLVLLLLGRRAGVIEAATGVETIDLGYVPSDHLKAAAYSAADLFVHPTRADSFGLVLLESVACGTPAVAFAVGGVPDVVRPGVTGALAPAGDVGALAGLTAGLLEDDGRRLALGRRCREVAAAEFGLDTHVARYRALYDEVARPAGAREPCAA